jgi:hypothetical protein
MPTNPYQNPAPDPSLWGGGQSAQDPNSFLAQSQAAWAANPNNPANAAAAAAPAGVAGAAPAATAPPPDPQFPNQNPTMLNPSMGQYGFLDPNAWQNWSQFGGADPSNWSQMGGGPANSGQFDFMQQFQQMMGGGANPTSVAPTSAEGLMSTAQPYIDSSMAESQRLLEPQMQAQNAAFDQQMINQGIPPGSEAYQQAKQQMMQGQNDAQAQARNQAMQQGLAAQGQAFGQGLSQSQLANTLAGQGLGANTSLTNALLGGNQTMAAGQQAGNNSLFNQLIGGNTSLSQALLGLQGSMYGANASSNASHYASGLQNQLGNAQLQQQGQQSDFGNLMQLLGMGSGMTQYNNSLLDQQQQNAMGFMGYMPGVGGGQLDVTGPYNNQYNGQMNNWNINNQQAQQQNQAAMNAMMMMMMCDRNAKEGCRELDINTTQILRDLPVERWRYLGQDVEHIGTYAQDFNKAIGKVGGNHRLIDPIDLFGFVLKSLKDITARFDRIEAKLGVA